MTRRLLTAAAVVVLVVSAATAQEIKWTSKDELRAAFGSADLTVIDVRTGKDWESSDSMVKGAVREDPDDVEQWAGKYPKDGLLVFY